MFFLDFGGFYVLKYLFFIFYILFFILAKAEHSEVRAIDSTSGIRGC